jgi:cardiolipin synthase
MAWTEHLPPLGELTGELLALALLAWGWAQLGRRKHRDLARGRSELRRLARRLGGETPETGNRLEVLADADGTAMLRALREGILGARRRICVGTYILSNDAVGREVAALLARRAREGLEVRLLVDAVGSRRPPWLALRRLRAAGGKVARFNPLLSLRGRGSANWRNHRKIAVFDGAVALVGGHNLGLWYVGDRPRRRRFRDASFRISGPAASALENVFLTDWCQATGAAPRELEEAFRDCPPPSGDVRAEVVDSGPDAPDDPLWHRLRDLVAGARVSVEIATPYFVPDAAMVATLRDRLAAGVRVRIVVPRFSDHPITDFARRATLRELADLGAEVLLHRRGVLHAKLVVVDGAAAVVGSANFDMRSFFLNYEVAVVVRGEAALRPIRDLMGELAAESRPPSAASVRRAHAWHGRLLERAAGWVAPLL